MATDTATNDEKPKTSNMRWLDNVLYLIAAFFIPTIFLFDLYNRNRIHNPLNFEHTLIIAAALAIIGVALLLLFRLITRTFEGALIISLLAWIGFWLFETTYALAVNLIAPLSRELWLAIGVVSLVIISICFRLYMPPFNKILPAFRILAIATFILFFINFIPGLHHEIVLHSASENDSNAVFYLKQDFNITPTLPSPDIYWLHMDGMMSLEVVEDFFGESQDFLRNELAKRGFIIYEDAYLNAGGTQIALPPLFSPAFYDSYFSMRLEEVRHLLRAQRYITITDLLAQDGLGLMDDIMTNHEVPRAFSAAGYETINISFIQAPFQKYSYNRIYNLYSENLPLMSNNSLISNFDSALDQFLTESSSLIQLISLAAPISIVQEQLLAPHAYESSDDADGTQWLSIPMHTEAVNHATANKPNTHMGDLGLFLERQLYRMLFDSFSVSSPKLLYMMFAFTHETWWHMHDADLTWGDAPFIDLYIPAHSYAAKAMLTAIDMILEENPNAIIVLQSDHGIHSDDIKNYLMDIGYTEDEVLKLYLSVFSAVRIPAQYGGLDAPLAPLNISRELVNRFVGQNYELLP